MLIYAEVQPDTVASLKLESSANFTGPAHDWLCRKQRKQCLKHHFKTFWNFRFILCGFEFSFIMHSCTFLRCHSLMLLLTEHFKVLVALC